MDRINKKLYWEPKRGEGYYYLTFWEKGEEMKLNIWIEVGPWDIGNDGELKQVPSVMTTPFTYPCSDNIQRFKATIEIPYKAMPVVEAENTVAKSV